MSKLKITRRELGKLNIMKFLKISYIYLMCLSLANAMETNITEKIKHTILTKDFAINTIESYKKGGLLFRRVIAIQPVEYKPNPSLDPTQKIAFPTVPVFGKPIWTITPEQLPVTESMCLDLPAAADCDKDMNELYSGGCYSPCMTYGPELVAYDEKNGKLYLTVASNDYGNAGGTNFTFVADINKKEVKFIHTDGGPLYGSLSSSGKYLLIISSPSITVYDNNTNQNFDFGEYNIYEPHATKLHYIKKIKWLNDTQFTYEEHVAHSKFQEGVDGITEYTYDISAQKKISRHVIKPNTYKYSAKDDEE